MLRHAPPPLPAPRQDLALILPLAVIECRRHKPKPEPCDLRNQIKLSCSYPWAFGCSEFMGGEIRGKSFSRRKGSGAPIPIWRKIASMQLCIRAGGAGLWRGEMQQGEEISKCELVVGLYNENTMRNGRWIKGCGRDGSRSGGGTARRRGGRGLRKREKERGRIVGGGLRASK